MIVEQISVGTELLLGKVLNTNVQFVAQQCGLMGLSNYYQSVVGDNEYRLADCLSVALQRSDCIIITGGLGPTADDITKEVVSKVIDRKLIVDETIAASVKDYYEKKGLELPDNYMNQCRIIEGSIVLPNDNGTASGMIIEHSDKIIILLPGPPAEMEPMFLNNVPKYIGDKIGDVYVTKTVKFCGITEGKLFEEVKDLKIDGNNPAIITSTKIGEVHMNIIARADNEKHAQKLIKPLIMELKSRFGQYIYTTESDVSLEKSVVDLLLANKMTISTIESCTGGLLAGQLINVSGVSEVFKLGHITYSNNAKRKALGVKKDTLEKYTAVSEQVAREMCKAELLIKKPDVVVAVTGLAGPEGGTKEKPVGLVYIGCSVKGKIKVKEFHFVGDREKIRKLAVANALAFTRESILEYLSEVTFGNGK